MTDKSVFDLADMIEDEGLHTVLNRYADAFTKKELAKVACKMMGCHTKSKCAFTFVVAMRNEDRALEWYDAWKAKTQPCTE